VVAIAISSEVDALYCNHWKLKQPAELHRRDFDRVVAGF